MLPLGDRRGLVRVHAGLGQLALEESDLTAARDHWRMALALSQELGNRWGIALCCDGAAAVCVRATQFARAARLFGAADTLRAAIGAPLPALFAAWRARELSAAQAQLGSAAFSAAHADEQPVPPEQALAWLDALQVAAPAPHAAAGSLTARELDVLRLVAQGMSDAQVAARLVVSIRTVNTHLHAIYGKLDVGSRTAAARYALDHKLI